MSNIEFDSLSVYINLAKKTINKFGSKMYGGLAKEMLQNDDAVADVAHAIMLGDWRWDENRKGKTGQQKTKYSYRNQCAIWAIQTYITKKYKKRNIHSVSLDYSKNDDSMNLKDILCSRDEDPYEILCQRETEKALREDIQFILNSNLISDKQREYIKLYFFEEYTLEKIGKKFNITREAVRQNINKALSNIKKTIDV